MREAVNKLLAEPIASQEAPKTDVRPIWEVLLENMKDVSQEEFAKLPRDGASEHDHYLYGQPKRTQ